MPTLKKYDPKRPVYFQKSTLLTPYSNVLILLKANIISKDVFYV